MVSFLLSYLPYYSIGKVCLMKSFQNQTLIWISGSQNCLNIQSLILYKDFWKVQSRFGPFYELFQVWKYFQRLYKQRLKIRNIGFTCCDQSFWIGTIFTEKLWKFQLHLQNFKEMICIKIKFRVSFQGKCSKYLHSQNIFTELVFQTSYPYLVIKLITW